MGDELGRLGCGEVESEHADVDRDRLDGVGSGDQDAGVVVDSFDNADCGIDPIEDSAAGACTVIRTCTCQPAKAVVRSTKAG